MGSEPGDKRELELRPVGLEPMAREVEEAMDGEARLERELFERPDGRRVFYERVFLAGEGWVSESIKGADSPTVLAEFLERRRAQLAERARVEREDRSRLERRFPELTLGAPVPSGPLGALRLAFARTFIRFDLALPDDDVALRRPGRITQRSWFIFYLWGEDEAGLYLEFYAANRFTNARHERIYEDGRTVHVGESFDPIMPAHFREIFGTDW